MKVYYCITINSTDKEDVMFTIQSKSSTPIFEQIIEQVGKYITLGILEPHDQLPTVRTLAKQLGINPNTVAKSYKICEERNLIYSEVGKGYFVADSQSGVNQVLKDAYEQLRSASLVLIEIGESKESIFDFLEREVL